MEISRQDSERLRSLAFQQAEIAHSPAMQALVQDWKRHGNFAADSRPMVSVELWTFASDILPQRMECQGEEARALETRLLSNLVNHVLFEDDTLVPDCMEFTYQAEFIPFGLPVRTEHAPSNHNSLGHHFVEQITDLQEDFHKLQPSRWVLTPKEETLAQMEAYNALLGDILPAKLIPASLVCCPTQNLVHLMSMETMFFSLYDYPELFLRMMDQLAEDYLAYFRALEADGRFGATTGAQHLCQGSYCFTNRLSDSLSRYTSQDIWGYLDSQETSGLSPEMYEEFIFPAYRKLMQQLGRVSYGCCEAVHPIWDTCLSQVPNLGKVSISPWCNEAAMGERLRGRAVTYLRKPSPNLLSLTKELDEAAVRAHIAQTVQAAKGCHLEIVQRDVYQICNTSEKVKRYVQLIRQECERHQN